MCIGSSYHLDHLLRGKKPPKTVTFNREFKRDIDMADIDLLRRELKVPDLFGLRIRSYKLWICRW